MNLENYPHKESIWGFEAVTEMLKQRVDSMPDKPYHIAIILTWHENEEKSVFSQFRGCGAMYDEIPMRLHDTPFRVFFSISRPAQHLIPDCFLFA